VTEIAIPENNAVATQAAHIAATAPSALMLWAAEAQQANQIAIKLAQTSFVPTTMRGKPDDITAAILAGQELGLQPMATLRSMDVIQGVPALRAHAMRGLVQSKGHKVEVVEASPTKVVMRGKRKGERDWQTVEWPIQRAAQLGLTGKAEWKKQPQTMLIARATGELCRLIAADALYAMPYAAEELDPVTAATTGSTTVSVTAEEILGAVEPTAVYPAGDAADADEYGQDEDNAPAWSPHDGHPPGEYDPWCRGCIETREADQRAEADS
jgi:hypothetical protein